MQIRITAEKKAYVQLTNVLGILQNNSKNTQRIVVIVFGIEIDISCFIARLSKEKLEKTTKAIAKVLDQNSVRFIDLQLLNGFLLFCLQAVRLGRIFMRKL